MPKKIKIYKESKFHLTNKNRAILLRLYFCPYQKKMLRKISGTIDELTLTVNGDNKYSNAGLRSTLTEFAEQGILVFDEFRNRSSCFHVDKKKIWEILEEDETFNKIFEMIENEYLMVPK